MPWYSVHMAWYTINMSQKSEHMSQYSVYMSQKLEPMPQNWVQTAWYSVPVFSIHNTCRPLCHAAFITAPIVHQHNTCVQPASGADKYPPRVTRPLNCHSSAPLICRSTIRTSNQKKPSLAKPSGITSDVCKSKASTEWPLQVAMVKDSAPTSRQNKT